MPLPTAIKPIERPLVREQVYLRLLDWIVRGLLQPGEKVRDIDLAQRLGVSRTPVREALRRLEDEGFVQTAVNRWTRVSPVSVREARQLYPIIWSLESLAIRTAGAKFTTADHEAMQRANQRLRLALQGKSPVEASTADHDFHDVFIRRSENPELSNILHALKLKLRRIEVAYFDGCIVAERSVAEHEAILHSLARGDGEASARAVEANWRNSLSRIADSIPETPHGLGSAGRRRSRTSG
jgi:DNA-binding GntR family transcriptional regulator